MKAILFLILFPISYSASAQAEADKILGIYWSSTKDAKIEIYKKEQKYFGKTIWSLKNGKDKENPDKTLRNRDITGMDFLTNFVYAKGAYVNGEVYDPRTGKSYDCKMTLDGTKLKIRGFIGLPVFGHTEILYKIIN